MTVATCLCSTMILWESCHNRAVKQGKGNSSDGPNSVDNGGGTAETACSLAKGFYAGPAKTH